MTIKIKPLPPLAELERLFFVKDGQLIRRTAQGGVKVGSVAGTPVVGGGHISVSIGNTRFLAHRIIWALCKGEDPAPFQIDHINGDRKDNRIENLRKVSHQQNSMHRTKSRENTKSGIIGISPHKIAGKWTAEICFNQKKIFLGVFENKEAALEARVAKEKELFGEYAPNR